MDDYFEKDGFLVEVLIEGKKKRLEYHIYSKSIEDALQEVNDFIKAKKRRGDKITITGYKLTSGIKEIALKETS